MGDLALLGFVARLLGGQPGGAGPFVVGIAAAGQAQALQVDGDDLALPGKLQTQADYLDAHPHCRLCYHEADMFDDESGRTIKLFTREFYNFRYLRPVGDRADLIRYGCFVNASSIMFRRHERMGEAIDAVRQVARKQGFDERHSFVVEQGLDWNQVYDACQAMSLFSARQIIELELPAKIDKDLAARISDIGKQLHPDLLLVLSGPRLNQTQMKAAWFDKLSQSGTYVPVNHPEPRFFPRWMSARFQRFGLKALPDAVNFMCHAYEGNLLAASQEIEKLTLLSPPQPISVAYLQETIIRHAHFTPFQLVDTLLEGKVNRAQRILLALRAEGTEPGMLAWTLCRELEQLTELALAARAGQPLVEHFSRLRIWQSRQQLIQQALTRLPFPKIRQLWQLMAQLDHAQRHFDTEQAWLMLQTITLGFRDGTPLPLLETESC